MLYAIVGMLVIILDQVVKYWVDTVITSANLSIPLIPNVVSIVRVANDGAAFSFLSGGGARIWFIALTAAFTIAVILALATNFVSGKFGRWCLVLVTAGGLANCIDRVLYGYVIDMFKIEIFNFAVLNVADIFITVFCIAFIIYILFGGEKELEPDADEFDEEDPEENDRPQRAPKKRKRERIVEIDEDEEDDDDDEEETSKKVSRKHPSPSKKDARTAASSAAVKTAKEDRVISSQGKRTAANTQRTLFDEMDSVTAQKQKTRVTSASFGSSSEDPFAEWERANAKARNNLTRTEKVQQQMEEVPAKTTTAKVSPDVQKAYSDLQKAKSSQPIETSSVQPSKKAAAPADDDFDLDAILNEFK